MPALVLFFSKQFIYPRRYNQKASPEEYNHFFHIVCFFKAINQKQVVGRCHKQQPQLPYKQDF
jgi:hypothetical protein